MALQRSLLIILLLPAFSFGETVDEKAARLLATLTLEQKVGQLFMVGERWNFAGSEARIGRLHIGNAYLGTDDARRLSPREVAALTRRLQETALKANGGIPLLIALDQEGGLVNRLVKGFVVFPGQEDISRNASLEQAGQVALMTAQQLKAVGVSVDLAPVLDIPTRLNNPIAAQRRSFGTDPERVLALGREYVENFRREGVIPCVKHFPNDGDVAEDPHDTLPVDDQPKEEIWKTSLHPYAALIKEGEVDMVLVSHALVPALDPDLTPASLSKPIIQGVLRGSLGFQGVVVTDELNMKALRDVPGGIGAIARKSVEAGADILLLAGFEEANEEAFNSLVDAFKRGDLPLARLDESVLRILKLKLRYLSFDHPTAEPKEIAGNVNTPEQRRLDDELRRKR